MTQIPTAKEFVVENRDKWLCTTEDYPTLSDWIAKYAVEYAKVHVEAALQAVCDKEERIRSSMCPTEEIVSAYPLENIK